jgi:hypothetical protein
MKTITEIYEEIVNEEIINEVKIIKGRPKKSQYNNTAYFDTEEFHILIKNNKAFAKKLEKWSKQRLIYIWEEPKLIGNFIAIDFPDSKYDDEYIASELIKYTDNIEG